MDTATMNVDTEGSVDKPSIKVVYANDVQSQRDDKLSNPKGLNPVRSESKLVPKSNKSDSKRGNDSRSGSYVARSRSNTTEFENIIEDIPGRDKKEGVAISQPTSRMMREPSNNRDNKSPTRPSSSR